MTPKTQVLLFPFGGNAREALLAVEALNREGAGLEVLGFLDDDPSTHGRDCCGIRVLGGREVAQDHPDAKLGLFLGNPRTFRSRRQVIESWSLPRERLISVVHPSAHVAPDATIGCNTLIMQGCTISTGVEIGSHCVILPNTVVSHDAVVGDYTIIGSNVSISGFVRIGQCCYVASRSCIRDGLRLGDESLVGLGSVVVKDVAAGQTVAGNPAGELA